MLQINLVLEIMAHRSGCLCFVATFRSRSGCSNLQRKILFFCTPDCGVCYTIETFWLLCLIVIAHNYYNNKSLFNYSNGAFLSLICSIKIEFDASSSNHTCMCHNILSLVVVWNRIIAPACPGPWSLGHQCLPWATRASPHLHSSPSPMPLCTLMLGDTCIPAAWPP